ncbi:hypothetical protein GCM10023088_21670 [Actinomadura verrucosospora]
MNPLDTRARIRVWRGGSSARNDIVRGAWGPQALGSTETPWELEKVAWSRKAADTSACRDSAQKPISSLR